MTAAGGAKQPGIVQDVAHRCRTKGVDRLGVISHHAQAAAIGLQPEQDPGLERVGVLVLVHQDVIETGAHTLRGRRLLHQA